MRDLTEKARVGRLFQQGMGKNVFSPDFDKIDYF